MGENKETKFDVMSSSVSETNPNENWKNLMIDQVERIRNNWQEKPNKKEDLMKWVEKPLLQACQELYMKGIRTMYSNANYKGMVYPYYAYIDLDYDTLSSENKKTLQKIKDDFDRKNYYIGETNIDRILICLMNKNTTMGEVHNKAMEIISKFKEQKPIWLEELEPLSLDEMIDKYVKLNNNLTKKEIDQGVTLLQRIIQFYEEKGYYYDKKNKQFLRNSDLRDKAGKLINS